MSPPPPAALSSTGAYVPVLAPVMEKLAHHSQRGLSAAAGGGGFLSFYRQATPIDALEHSRIGSRPSRRTGKPSLADLRAIPWVFSWNQARFYVPGWFGAGSGLAALSEEELANRARSARLAVRPLRADERGESFASADPELMRLYAGLVPDEALRDRFLTRSSRNGS